jgi:hypothetical protein
VSPVEELFPAIVNCFTIGRGEPVQCPAQLTLLLKVKTNPSLRRALLIL